MKGKMTLFNFRIRRCSRMSLVFCILAAGPAMGNCSALRSPAQNSAEGRTALRSGEYAKAKSRFEAALKADPGDQDAQAGLIETLRETGAYAQARGQGQKFLATHPDSAPLHLELGRTLRAVGDYEGAEREFRRALSLGGSLSMAAARRLGELLEELGRKEEAAPLWNRLIDRYRGGGVRGSTDLESVAVALWRLDYIQDAKDLFVDATTESTAGGEISLEALCDFGYLFLDKYDPGQAMDVFKDCLKINPSRPEALLGMALAKEYSTSAEVETYARKALEANPNLVAARNVLAGLDIQEDRREEAREEIRRALTVNPASLETLTLEAVASYLDRNEADFVGLEKKILGINPRYGSLYHSLAENLVLQRKYADAIPFYRKAIELDPKLYQAYAGLGMNLMRIGRLEEGRRMLERAFDGDPFNVWAYNTLSLLDQMDKFATVRTEHFVFKMAREDEPVLAPYARKLAEEMYGALTRRYRFTPEGPLQFEIFPDEGGFSVRTLGLPELMALGVCFGKVVALDSPRAKKPESFNWGSTLWHEFTHVITLQMSGYNIPRWYSEGLSVYEERRARPGWGDDLNASFVKAYKEGKLLKIGELNAGMMRPKSPEQVTLSYYQASLFCELIEERFGFDAIRRSLELFAQNQPSAEVFRNVLGWSPEEMETEYSRFLDRRLRALASRLDFDRIAERPAGRGGAGAEELKDVLRRNPDDFFANLQLGALLVKENSGREAKTYLKKAEELFPEYVGPGNPYEALGRMYLEEKREDDALEQFLGWSRYDETALFPLKESAEIYRGRKDWAHAAGRLDLAVYVYPYDPGIHSELGEAAMEAGNWPAAVAAYQVLLGLGPPDPAAAHYDLARAWLGYGKKAEAKKEVLRALEIAPTYAKAQKMLLELSGKEP